jgi:hypothetical protein
VAAIASMPLERGLAHHANLNPIMNSIARLHSPLSRALMREAPEPGWPEMAAPFHFK